MYFAISVMPGSVRKTSMTGIGDLEQLVPLWNERLPNRKLTTPLEFGLSAYPKSEIVASLTVRFEMHVD
jgi:hypothetical protein